MNNENTFRYTYSAPNHREIQDIRSKYLPKEETKLEELKRLDNLVQNSGVAEALCMGILGCLIFGLGLCLAMKVIGSIVWPGILVGLVGFGGMLCTYPVYRWIFNKAKARYAPRILELTDELSRQI